MDSTIHTFGDLQRIIRTPVFVLVQQIEAIIVVHFVMMLRGPKYGSTQMQYNPCICVLYSSVYKKNS